MLKQMRHLLADGVLGGVTNVDLDAEVDEKLTPPTTADAALREARSVELS